MRRTVTRLALRCYASKASTGGLRSFLFIPGREKMLNKVLSEQGWNADVIVPDMDDAVPYSEKESARAIIKANLDRLKDLPARILPRVNAANTKWFLDDIAAVVSPSIYGITIAKVSSADEIKHACSYISSLEDNHPEMTVGQLKLFPWLETSAGVMNAAEICQASDRIVGACFGADDFLTDMGIQAESDKAINPLMSHARSTMSIACNATGTLALETPFVNFKSESGLQEAAHRAKILGFKGMFAIHPCQVDTINTAFQPTEQEIAYARAVVDAYDEVKRNGVGTTSVNGKMIDLPIVKRCEALLASLL
eukprot:TRINITY_DN10089_c0_g1_i1.p1 TRINITY_DN10089_c0_g1~~TRINITY_DN10089_c0_g1_i1.p1  ORF type:complete len:331 (-),score=52.77 TRINITY_DN10089_c0_g1_i1:84-1013(-)